MENKLVQSDSQKDSSSILIKCECCCCGLEVSLDKEEDIPDQFWFAFWSMGNYGQAPMMWKEQLRWIWNILWTGNPWSDHVILSKSSAKELSEFLNKNL